MIRKFVKPATPELYVMDELNRRIPAEGMEVNYTTFISRLVKEGALIVEPEKPAVKQPAKKEKGE